MLADAVMKAKVIHLDLKSIVPLVLIPMTLILAVNLSACVAPIPAPPPESAPASTQTSESSEQKFREVYCLIIYY